MEDDLISVLPSPGKGLGVFALRDIQPGTTIHSEAPVIIIPKLPSTIKDDDINTALVALDPAQRQQYSSLSAPPTHHKTDAARIFFGNAFAYPFPDNAQSTCLCLRTARFNHSCLPNAEMAFHPITGRCELFATTSIGKGEEICFCYLQESHCMPRSYRQFMQFLTWRFVCTCPACEPSISSVEFCEASDARREAMYALRARLENFSLPVLSMKLVMRTGIPMAEVWRPGELQRLLTNLWMPQPAAWAKRHETLAERIEAWKKLINLMRDENLIGKELARYYGLLVPLLLESSKAGNAVEDETSTLQTSGNDVRFWADEGMDAMISCRSKGHPDIVDYEKQFQGWVSTLPTK